MEMPKVVAVLFVQVSVAVAVVVLDPFGGLGSVTAVGLRLQEINLVPAPPTL